MYPSTRRVCGAEKGAKEVSGERTYKSRLHLDAPQRHPSLTTKDLSVSSVRLWDGRHGWLYRFMAIVKNVCIIPGNPTIDMHLS